MVGLKDFEMPKSCFLCGLKFQGVCPRLIKNVQGLRKERLLDCPLVEAIPKEQYEARLKDDMVAMLEELDLQIEELFYRKRPFTWDDTGEKGMMDIRPSYDDICFLIREKINALRGNEDDNC